MFIHLKDSGQVRLSDICDTLGKEEILGQLTEECGELIQAAQKVRRALKGTTPVSLEEAQVHLTEEIADVALCMDAIIELGFVERTGIQFIGRYKCDRWHSRIVERSHET